MITLNVVKGEARQLASDGQFWVTWEFARGHRREGLFVGYCAGVVVGGLAMAALGWIAFG